MVSGSLDKICDEKTVAGGFTGRWNISSWLKWQKENWAVIVHRFAMKATKTTATTKMVKYIHKTCNEMSVEKRVHTYYTVVQAKMICS